MLKNEVGNDGAAPAMENTTRNENLLSEFSSALSDSTALKVAAGTAVLAAGVVAAVAATKYLRPAIEAGKAVGAVADDGVLTAVRTAAKEVDLAKPASAVRDPKALDAARAGADDVFKPFDHAGYAPVPPIKTLDTHGIRFAMPKPGDTGVLAVESGGRVAAPATDALLSASIPISASTRAAAGLERIRAAVGAGEMPPATEALIKNSIPIDASMRAAAKPLMPATEALVKESVPISASTRTAVTEAAALFQPFDLAGYRHVAPKIPGVDAAAVLKNRSADNAFIPKTAHVDGASVRMHEAGHRSNPSEIFTSKDRDAWAQALADQMPKPATEANIAAISQKVSARIEPGLVNDIIAKATKGA